MAVVSLTATGPCCLLAHYIWNSTPAQFEGLNRFSRRGLAAVRREFALHALAYNLGRAVALLQAIYGLLLAGSLLIRRVQRPIHID